MKTAAEIDAQKARKKQWVTFFVVRLAILLVLLIPTYIAIASYVIEKNAPEENTLPAFDAISLSGPSGNAIGAQPDSDALLSLFLPLLGEGEEVPNVPSSHVNGHYVAIMHGVDTQKTYQFYFAKDSRDCYYTAPDGITFEVREHENTLRFLNSASAFELYESAKAPTLTTAVTDEVAPTHVTWYYRTQDGSFTSLSQTAAADSTRTYPIAANDMVFYFSVEPDAHEVVIKNGDEILYRGSVTNISLPSFDNDADFLDLEISATYEQKDQNNFYGTLTYKFRMEVVEAAKFTPATTQIPLGGHFVVRCDNVSNVDKLHVNVTPLGATPIAFQKDGALYIAIPANEIGTRTMQITYGTITKNFELETTAASGTHHAVDDSLYATLLSTLPDLISKKGAALSETLITDTTLIPHGVFASYQAERIYRFGDTLTVNGIDLSDTPIGFDLYRLDGAVTALSAGTVREVGTHETLGKYVIVDHGCGLYTWYAGLSEIRVRKGEVLRYGDTIGLSGTTLHKENSVLVMATLGKELLSTEHLATYGFEWKSPVTE